MSYGWHFTGNKLRDGRPLPRRGVWLRHDGPIKWCQSGLYFSRHPFDALTYAPGPMLHRVEVRDVIREDDDKSVCRQRRIVASMDATEMLWYFTRIQALSVVHLWGAPDVVLDYLMTGDESMRAAAGVAAMAAARAAASVAAGVAAMATAGATAWDAARDAAWAAAWEAAKSDFAALVNECFERWV